MPLIQSDSRQKKKHHTVKERYFVHEGYTVVTSKLLVGDYAIPSKGNVAVDTKASMSEMYGNLIQDHVRFRNECILARDAGIKLYVLIENKDGISCVDDLVKWSNPQFYRYYKAKKEATATGSKEPKPPASNVQLIKIMHSMKRDYGVEFVFCSPDKAGEMVLELLGER